MCVCVCVCVSVQGLSDGKKEEIYCPILLHRWNFVPLLITWVNCSKLGLSVEMSLLINPWGKSFYKAFICVMK